LPGSILCIHVRRFDGWGYGVGFALKFCKSFDLLESTRDQIRRIALDPRMRGRRSFNLCCEFCDGLKAFDVAATPSFIKLIVQRRERARVFLSVYELLCLIQSRLRDGRPLFDDSLPR
jgi:hypothetical protein